MHDIYDIIWRHWNMTDYNYTSAELVAWDIYFATMYGWALHPGNYAKPPDPQHYAKLADDMINERRKRSS